VGALVAGPLAARIGVSATQYGAAAITLVASALALIPREVRTMRWGSVEQVPTDRAAVLAVADAEPEPELVSAALAEPELAAQTAC
jgi:hypothetical protein